MNSPTSTTFIPSAPVLPPRSALAPTSTPLRPPPHAPLSAPRMTCAPLVPSNQDHDTHPILSFSPPNLSQLADLELRLGDLPAAHKLFQQQVHADPRDARVWLKWANTASPLEAHFILRRAVKILPTDPYLWHALAAVVKKVKGAKEATLVYETALEFCPKSAALLSAWGVVESELANFDRALALMAKSVAVDHRDVHCYMKWAQIELRRGNMKAAIAVYERGVKNVEKNKAALLYSAWARAAVKDRKIEKARFLYMRAAEADSNNGWVWQNWACLESRMGNVERARELFERGVVADSTFVGIWQAWGMLELRARDLDRARGLFERGTIVDEGDSACWQAWAALEAADGKIEEAKRLYAMAKDTVGPQSRAAVIYLGWARLEADCANFEKARQLYKEGVERKGERTQDLVRLLHSWAGLERRDGCVEVARNLYYRALKLNGRDGKTLHALARLEEEDGKHQVARRLLGKCVSLDARDIMAVRALGTLIWKRFGEVDTARSLFRRTAQQCPNNPGFIRFWAAFEEEQGAKDLAARLRALASRTKRR